MSIASFSTPGRPRPALLPLSALFGQGVRLRNALYDTGWFRVHCLQVPVVSIGNLSVGGTGKTPLVALLARRLHRAGRRPAIVSRGYGGRNARRRLATPLLVSAGTGTGPAVPAAECGDEPALLASLLPEVPLVVGRDRVAAARLAVDRCDADLIVLDDGFQHRRLHRDADLVTLDAETPLGPARLLPAGRLREKPTALERSHAVLITRADDDDLFEQRRAEVWAVFPHLPVYRSRHVPVSLRTLGERAGGGPSAGESRSPLPELRGESVAAFAGLARPMALRRTLEGLGARVVRFDALPDHHRFTPDEVERLIATGLQSGARRVITSAKDAVRLPVASAAAASLWVLDIEAQVDDLDDLIRRVLALCPVPPSCAVEAG